MGISEQDVKKIARLARLSVTAEETKRYQEQLGKILESMAELKAVDTSTVPPTSSVLGVTNVMRDDKAEPFAAAEKLLELSPEREGPYFKVRKVIE
ncbi:MAG: Asp-tRNA(Asn)/Glu-tRNA(Gln) amidotransferase subunit GatC [Elusimicrobia bacterium]|nr:Asp-tRNA(Asn)/Glu-tRNA(Gln) amidotransferase subunit GatC [Elusimicrobiota bacterium]